jgi:hypothetical protein
MTGRQPDFILKATSRTESFITPRLGAGWANESGSISIRIDPFVTLEDNAGYTFVLYPNKYKEKDDDKED